MKTHAGKIELLKISLALYPQNENIHYGKIDIMFGEVVRLLSTFNACKPAVQSERRKVFYMSNIKARETMTYCTRIAIIQYTKIAIICVKL